MQGAKTLIPFHGYEKLLERRFEEAISLFLAERDTHGLSAALSSALAAAYHGLGFQTLADQVRRSVRSVRGNQWMFRTGHPADYPLRIRPRVAAGRTPDGSFPILRETTPGAHGSDAQRLERHFLSGNGFPGRGAGAECFDRPERARAGSPAPKPPVEAYLRVIDEPVLRLTSVDLERTRRNHRACRSVRFRARLPGLVEGGGDCVRDRAAGDGRLRASRWPNLLAR